jgi:PAS domain S-box-containing protein
MTRLLEEAQEMGHMGNWTAEMKEDGNAWWSKEALRIYGMTPEEFDGKSATYFKHVHPEDLALMYSVSGQAINEHKPFSLEHRIVLNDGSVKWVHNRGYAEYDANGVPVKLIGTVQDVTEKKIAENELIDKNTELTMINSELDRFVYSASHDIRSPLMSILGIVNIAEDEINDPVALDYFKMIEKTAMKLDEFTMEIIYWSRNRRLDTIPDILEVTEMIHGVIDSLRHQKIARGIEFIVDAKEYVPFVTDKLRLRIIMYNLIANGIIYQKPGNEQGYVKISAAVDKDDMLKIEVEDNGIGIEECNIPKIFEMFTRLADNSHGSGLGLYIVKEAVEKVKGQIEVSSSPGVGTKFTVSLPAMKDVLSED